MALKQSAHARGVIPTPVAAGCEVVCCRAVIDLTGDLSANDILQMMYLPADHVPVDLIVDSDDLGTTGAVSVGLANADLDDIDGAAWLTSGDVATAAAGLRADSAGLRAMARCAADKSADRPVVIKIATDTTATSGTIGLTLLYRSA